MCIGNKGGHLVQSVYTGHAMDCSLLLLSELSDKIVLKFSDTVIAQSQKGVRLITGRMYGSLE